VEVSPDESTLLPISQDDLTFRIAVKMRAPGNSRLEYEFAHGAGFEPATRRLEVRKAASKGGCAGAGRQVQMV
jgi:hypothetical protein